MWAPSEAMEALVLHLLSHVGRSIIAEPRTEGLWPPSLSPALSNGNCLLDVLAAAPLLLQNRAQPFSFDSNALLGKDERLVLLLLVVGFASTLRITLLRSELATALSAFLH